MIAYWQIHHSILNYLKEWNDAGVIGALAAAGTLAAVVVALLPTIKAWWTRPKLVLEIPVNASQVSEKPLEGTGATFAFADRRRSRLRRVAYGPRDRGLAELCIDRIARTSDAPGTKRGNPTVAIVCL